MTTVTIFLLVALVICCMWVVNKQARTIISLNKKTIELENKLEHIIKPYVEKLEAQIKSLKEEKEVYTVSGVGSGYGMVSEPPEHPLLTKEALQGILNESLDGTRRLSDVIEPDNKLDDVIEIMERGDADTD